MTTTAFPSVPVVFTVLALCAAPAFAQDIDTLSPCLAQLDSTDDYAAVFVQDGWTSAEGEMRTRAANSMAEIRNATAFLLPAPESLAEMPAFAQRLTSGADQYHKYATLLVKGDLNLMVALAPQGSAEKVECILTGKNIPWVTENVPTGDQAFGAELSINMVSLDHPPPADNTIVFDVAAVRFQLPLGGRLLIAGGDAIATSHMFKPSSDN